MTSRVILSSAEPELKLSQDTFAEINRCYQCKKCSSGCPVSFAMDLLPHQIMKLSQLGRESDVLAKNTHWICSSCQTCSTRCPNDIDITGVMDEYRQIASRKSAVSEKNLEIFHRLFLREIHNYGRVHELSVIAKYKLRSGNLFEDVPMGIGMFRKGKLKLFPKKIRRPREIRNLFK